jgi:hypothetical protein
MSLVEKSPELASEKIIAEANPLQKLLDFLAELEDRSIYYKLNCVRDAIMVEIAVPGQRWEVEFFANGQIETEVFESGGEIKNEEALKELFEKFSE